MKECSTGMSIRCGYCTYWFHAKCVDGMTPEFIDTCDKLNKIGGGSAFLCVICRKIISLHNKFLGDAQGEIKDLRHQLQIAQLEIKNLAEQLARLDDKSKQVTCKMGDMEKEIETGMEKAISEVREEMAAETKEKEARSANIVINGIAESDKDARKGWNATMRLY